MKMLLNAALVLAVALFACSCGGGASSPKGAVEAMASAAKAKDKDKMFKAMSKETHKMMADMFRSVAKMSDESAKKMGLTKEEAEKLSDLDLLLKMKSDETHDMSSDFGEVEKWGEEKDNGDNTGWVEVTSKGKTQKVWCRKEGDSWKVCLMLSAEKEGLK